PGLVFIPPLTLCHAQHDKVPPRGTITKPEILSLYGCAAFPVCTCSEYTQRYAGAVCPDATTRRMRYGLDVAPIEAVRLTRYTPSRLNVNSVPPLTVAVTQSDAGSFMSAVSNRMRVQVSKGRDCAEVCRKICVEYAAPVAPSTAATRDRRASN